MIGGINAGGAAGAGLMIGGALLSSFGANKRKRQLQQIAETPGIDSRATTGEALADMEANMPAARRVAGAENTFNQEELNRIMELAVPGYGGLQGKRSANSMSLLRGELPADVAALIQRKSASSAVAGGYGGSGAARNLTLRDLGLTSLDAMREGNAMATSLIGSSPVAQLAQLSRFTGLSPQELIAMRSRERFDRMDRLTGSALAPKMIDVMGAGLQQAGGVMAGSSGKG